MPKEPAWRSLPPTSRQLAMLRARGVSAPSTRGACSDAISRLLEDDDDKPRPATEFVRPNAHSITFVKECLDHHCRTCGYEWETETLDAKETKT